MTKGIIVGEQGTDVSRSPVYQHVLDSRVKYLNIVSDEFISQSFTVAASGTVDFKLANHGQPFAPAYDWDDALGYPVVVGIPFDIGVSSFYSVVSQADGIYVHAFVSSGESFPFSFTVQGKLIVYDYDPTFEYQSDQNQSTAQSSSKVSQGVANSLEGYQVTEREFAKFSLSTKAKLQAVHMSGQRKVDAVPASTVGEITITHNLGYMPSYHIYEITTSNGVTQLHNGLTARTYGTPKTLGFGGAQQSLANVLLAYIIFHDPVLLDAKV